MLKNLQAGQKMCQAVLVKVQKIATSSKGSLFARGALEDNSGVLPFICFEESLVRKMQQLDGVTAFMVGGDVDINKFSDDMSLQLIVKRFDNLVPGDDISNLVPHGDFDVKAYENKLANFMNAVKTPTLRQLLKNIFSGETYEAFVRNPAGMKMHHAYIGGLLQHSVDVCDLALGMAERVEGVDKDLVITGALLHDIGKLREISADLGFPYTSTGRFMGHIAMGALMVQEAAAKSKLPARSLEQLQHIILSHHGDNEKGSPVVCATREAFIVHYADELNAIMNQFEHCEGKSAWEYNRMLGRNILVKEL